MVARNRIGRKKQVSEVFQIVPLMHQTKLRIPFNSPIMRSSTAPVIWGCDSTIYKTKFRLSWSKLQLLGGLQNVYIEELRSFNGPNQLLVKDAQT